MNTDNFLVRPARQWVETYSELGRLAADATGEGG